MRAPAWIISPRDSDLWGQCVSGKQKKFSAVQHKLNTHAARHLLTQETKYKTDKLSTKGGIKFRLNGYSAYLF